MSHRVFARDAETWGDLENWLEGQIPGASMHELDGEIIIHTGMTTDMNGELYQIGETEEWEDDGD